MKEIVKAFTHIARDILIYMLPGLILLLYVLFVCDFGFNKDYICKVIANKYMPIVIVVVYVIGHVIFAFMELFSLFKIDRIVQECVYMREFACLEKDKESTTEEKLEIEVFTYKSEYEFFVERHTQLSLFRWNLSGAFLFIYIISSFLFVFHFSIFTCYLFLIGLLSLFIFIVLFVLSVKTEMDGNCRRNYLYKKSIGEKNFLSIILLMMLFEK